MVDFYPADVASSLVALRDHQALNQDPHTITHVRVQRDAFARDLAKAQSISCPYCREWAAYVYKQFFLPSPNAAGGGGSRGDQRHVESRRKKFAGGGGGGPGGGSGGEPAAPPDGAAAKGPTNVFLQQVWEAVSDLAGTDRAAKAFGAFTAGDTEILLTLLEAVFSEANANAAARESKPGPTSSTSDPAGGEDAPEKPEAKPKHAANGDTAYLESFSLQISRWIALPPQNVTMPDFASPVVVSPRVVSGSSEDWRTYPLEVLDAVNWDDRSFLTLPVDDIQRLRSLSRDLLEDQMFSGGACHPRSKWKTPAEEKVARDAVSGEIERLGHDPQAEMEKALADVWKPLRDALAVIREQQAAREAVLGHASIQKLMKTFEDKHSEALAGFVLHEKYKKSGKKKGKGNVQEFTVSDVENGFTSFMQRLDDVNTALLEDFLFPLASEVMNIVEGTAAKLLTAADEAKARLTAMATVTPNTKRSFDHLFNIIREAFSLLIILTTKQLNQLEVDLLARIGEQADELDGIINVFLEETQPTTAGRLEKLNNAAFRKRIRRFEHAQQSLRAWFLEACELRLLPLKAIAGAALPLLDTLMREGERREGTVLSQMIHPETEMFKTLQTINSKRAAAVVEFSECVSTGRCELSLFVARCFLKEAHRMTLEARALKRQKSLLQQVNSDASSGGKKKKSKGASQPLAGNGVRPGTPQSATSSTNDATGDGSKKKNKKKKDVVISADKDSAADGNLLAPARVDHIHESNPEPGKDAASACPPRPAGLAAPAPVESPDSTARALSNGVDGRTSATPPEPGATTFHVKMSSNDVHDPADCATPLAAAANLFANPQMPGKSVAASAERKSTAAEPTCPQVPPAFAKPPLPIGSPLLPDQVSSPSAANTSAGRPPPGIANGGSQSEPTPTSSASSSVIDPLPGDLENYPPDRLVAFIRSLHEEKAHLITVVLNMQKQVASLSTRYVELLQVARGMDEDRRAREADHQRGWQAGLRQPNVGAVGDGEVSPRRDARIDGDGHRHEGRIPEKVRSGLQEPGPYNGAADAPRRSAAPPPGLFIPSPQAGTPGRGSPVPSHASSGGVTPIRQPRIPGPHSDGFAARGSGRRPASGRQPQPSVHHVRCDRCFERGHVSAQCTAGCAECGSADHFTADCGA
ncbi:MAG: hypothetical protein BJ554DRAFT_5360 [Olpidium bornovanus]|uniref:CCHC-type domain-containing protein n=1 Tax=Olpidium bornovanus TaxID=278681 RepID=A0A8H7ZZH8_9FUNG|nr:MAG: hypothetical protein BJ554DRAFT_5360 [Olpidium bornovanus]